MENAKTNIKFGLGFFQVLFIVFLVLKLGVGHTTVMGWSWWWVCAPLWIPFVASFTIFVILAAVWIWANSRGY